MSISTGSTLLASDMQSYVASGKTISAGRICYASDVKMSVSVGTLIKPNIISTRYIIQNGSLVNGYTASKCTSGTIYIGSENGYYYVNTYQGGSNDTISCYFGTVSGVGTTWKTLVISSREVGNGSWVGTTSAKGAKEASYLQSVKLSGQRSSFNSQHTSTLALSNTSAQYIAIKTSSWMTWDQYGTVYGAGGKVQTYNMYLRSW